MKHININVFGKVQGVWFRQSTLKKANELGLAGYAKNMPDGTVRIEAEGSEEALKELLNWCQEGPEHANVTDIEHEEGEAKNYKEFSIY